jgi:CubicO group peptidase (beta-lactamase class C family)
MKHLIFFYLCLLIPVSKVLGFSEQVFKEQVEHSVESYMKQYNGAGLAITVFKNSFGMERAYSQNFCFGYSKRSSKAPIKEFTFFRLGGLSKTFLALGVIQAIQERCFSFEEGIANYLPKTWTLLKHSGGEVKLINLLIHNSGLPAIPTIPMKLYQASEIDIKNYLRTYKIQKAPGKKYESSDLGYALLAYILTREKKISYENFLLENILKPLGMQGTHYALPLSKMHHLATGYKGIAEMGDQFIDRDGSFFKPVHGLISNIEDMKKWLAFFLGESAASLNTSLKHLYHHVYAHPENTLKKIASGFCVEPLSATQSLMTYKDDGIYQGFSYAIAFIPDTKTGVLILSNAEYTVAHLASTLLGLLNQ